MENVAILPSIEFESGSCRESTAKAALGLGERRRLDHC